MKFSPLTLKRFRRFRSIRRGWWSFLLLVTLYALSLVAELFINNRALLVSYKGDLRFPTYGAVIPGRAFGLDYDGETNYRELKQRLAQSGDGWVLLAPVPYSPLENDFTPGLKHPAKPLQNGHPLGTDNTGRDVFARLVYGFRITMSFALAFALGTFVIATVIGCATGYFGGITDLLGQRLVEIWTNLPFLYMVIIAVAVVPSDLPVGYKVAMLLTIMVVFSWSEKAQFMRTATLKEKSRDYVAAVRLTGAGAGRVIFRHILPNTTATLITFLPFTVSSAISSLTALDFINFGLPRPMPSWGEMLEIGLATSSKASWIITSTFVAISSVLLLVTFVGEAVREAFDPKRFSTYR